MGRNITGPVDTVKKFSSSKLINIVSYALKMGVNGCHTSVCSLFQVIKHISTGLYVYELTPMCSPKEMCDWQKLYLLYLCCGGIC